MLRVGLTGGLASGKSSVAATLRRHGIPVLDADAVVHDLYRKGGAGAAVVSAEFGADYLDAAGAVDRKKLARRVFEDPATLHRLDALIHPLVFLAERRWLEEQEKAGEPVAVVEATLIAETGGRARYDLLVTISAAEPLRVDRALSRLPGATRDEVRQRIAAQASDGTREEIADLVIHNDGEPKALEAAAAKLAASLRSRASRR